MPVLFATHNAGKTRELSALLGPLCEVVTPAQLGLSLGVDENADSFRGNALKKARAFCEASGLPSLADDSGLCVEALQGAPGVHSARYGKDDAQRILRLLGELQGTPMEKRQAFFECVLCLVLPDGKTVFESGRCHGLIPLAPSGRAGFGYDPIFLVPTLGKTFAELSTEEKSAVSHRGEALRKMAPHLQRL